MIFGQDNHRNWVQDKNRVFIDGTFTLAPPLFSQVFVLHAKRAGYVFPVMYALLPKKCQETLMDYSDLSKRYGHLSIQRWVSCDFKMAVVKFIRQEFPRAELHGCLFQLMKSMRHQLSDNVLLQRSNTEPRFALHARMIVVLRLVPIDNLDEVFDALSNQLANELTPILNWFEDNYIGWPERNHCRSHPAIFLPEIWSVWQCVISDIDRPNNHAEAAHRHLKRELNVVHPQSESS